MYDCSNRLGVRLVDFILDSPWFESPKYRAYLWQFFWPPCLVSTHWPSGSKWIARGKRRSRCVPERRLRARIQCPWQCPQQRAPVLRVIAKLVILFLLHRLKISDWPLTLSSFFQKGDSGFRVFPAPWQIRYAGMAPAPLDAELPSWQHSWISVLSEPQNPAKPATSRHHRAHLQAQEKTRTTTRLQGVWC